MSDLQRYIKKRKSKDHEFLKGYEEGFEEFKIGLVLRQEREKCGLSQQELAKKMNTTKSAISRIENHSEDIKLSTLMKAAKALGKNLSVKII